MSFGPIVPVNDPPVLADTTGDGNPDGGDLAVTTPEDTPVSGAIAVIDVDGDILNYTVTEAPAHGSVAVNQDGTYTYTPAPDYNGPDTFTVTVSDGNGGSIDVVVDVLVTPVQDAFDDVATVPEDGTVTFAVLGNDTFSGPVDVTIETPPSFGTVVVNPDGSITYQPAPDFHGTDTLTYLVVTASGTVETATVTFEVTPVQDARDDFVEIQSGQPVVLEPLANDTFSGPVTVTGAVASEGGTVTINSNGTLSYQPAPGFSGVETVTYVVTDAFGNTEGATIIVRVAAPPSLEETGPRPTTILDRPILAPLRVEGIVLETANGIQSLGTISSVSAEGIVLDAANALGGLGGISEATGVLAAIERLDPAVRQALWNGASSLQEAVERAVGGFDVSTLSGFSLRLDLSEDVGGDASRPQIVFDVLVRDRTLVVQITNTVVGQEVGVSGYAITERSRGTLPDWLQRVDEGLLVGQRPADADALELDVTVLYRDGTSEQRAIRIATASGETVELAGGGSGSR